MRSPRVVGGLVITLLVLVGCGGGEDEDDTASETTVTEASSTTAPDDSSTTAPDSTTTAPAGDEPAAAGTPEAAEAAVVAISDLPTGWAARPDAEALDVEPIWQDLLACGGVTDPSGGETARATSPTFLVDLGTQVTSTVMYFDSPERAAALAAALAGDEVLACAPDVFLAALVANNPPEFGFSDVAVAPLAFDGGGETTVAYRVTGTRSINDLTFPFFQDLVVAFDGESVSRLLFTNPGAPFAEELQRTLVETVVGRV